MHDAATLIATDVRNTNLGDSPGAQTTSRPVQSQHAQRAQRAPRDNKDLQLWAGPKDGVRALVAQVAAVCDVELGQVGQRRKALCHVVGEEEVAQVEHTQA